MKLLIYSHFFAPSIGGVETVVLSLAQGLADFHGGNAEAFEITLVTQTAKGDFDDRSLPFSVVRRPGLFQLWKLMRRTDLLHAAGPAIAPLFLAILAGKRAVVEHHGYQVTCPNGLLFHHPTQRACPGHFKRHNYFECLRCNRKNDGLWRAVRLLALTPVREALCRHAALNIAPTTHVAARNVLRNSSVIFHGTQDKAPAKRSVSAQVHHNFAYVGRMVTEKGVIVLLQAARILLNENYSFSIKLIGDGPEQLAIQKQIEGLALQAVVVCTGLLLDGALDNALADVGTIIMPTIMEETAGMAAIEQMMRGRLVIGSDIGGLSEVLGDAGLKFTPGDAPGLAARMKQVLQDASLIDVLGGKARERARRYFLRESMIANHAQAYLDVLARGA